MPRIPVRTTPYTTLPRCTRHYKAKRDLILKQLGKATFINGSQFVVAFISPKGDVDAYASELLQPSLNSRDSQRCCLNKAELDALSVEIKAKMVMQWAEVERLAEANKASKTNADAADVIGIEEMELALSRSTSPFDNDSTLVGDEIDYKHLINEDALEIKKIDTVVCNSVDTTQVSTPAPEPDSTLWPIEMKLGEVTQYYENRLHDIQQNACKLICKNWVKIIEPKKQVNHPYNGGEASRPDWWPIGTRHREPDHLSKQGMLFI